MNKILKRYQTFTLIALLPLVLLPFLLKLQVGNYADSISAFYYTNASADFVMLLTISAMLYIVDGVINNKWYQFLNGVALLGVAKFGHLDYSVIHYVCAGYYFIGNAFMISFYSSTKQRWFKIIPMSILLLSYWFVYTEQLTLLQWEWIGLCLFIANHGGEVTKKID